MQVRNLCYSIGERDLIDNASFVINPGKRVALIGANGSGKTTLLRILNGDLKAHSGEMIKPKEYSIGYLPQEDTLFSNGSVLQAAMTGNQEIMSLEKEMQAIHDKLDKSRQHDTQLITKLGQLEHRFDLLGGYAHQAEAKAILAGLGFDETEYERPLQELSGGWRMRVYLARLLLQKPDLLLLDEPTNHLDLPSLEWLESYLTSFPGSMILVSHDRFFIDRLADEILELLKSKLYHYVGSYHDYEQQKELRLEQLEKAAQKEMKERQHLQQFVDRFRYKATKAAQVQSRLKRLEKMDHVEPEKEEAAIRFQLRVNMPSYQHVLKVKNLYFSYDKDPVLKDVNFDLYRGDKIALVGPNGAGKTTFTKLVFGDLEPTSGVCQVGERVKMGYYAQHQIDALKPDATVYDEVVSAIADELVGQVRNILGVFHFHGDDVFKPIRVLSGGEKARVSLAKILLSPVNFLIMDEPTNHLDLKSKQALEHALAGYDGSLLLISHDRYFLDQLVNRIVSVKKGEFNVYEGNYSDYLRDRDEKNQELQTDTGAPDGRGGSGRKSRDQKRSEAQARQAVSKTRKDLEKAIKEHEDRIDHLENEKSTVEARLADPLTYKSEQAADFQKYYADIQNELEQHLKDWEIKHRQLDELLKDLMT
jgi:ATP-binding cassette subfamily F protein 3